MIVDYILETNHHKGLEKKITLRKSTLKNRCKIYSHFQNDHQGAYSNRNRYTVISLIKLKTAFLGLQIAILRNRLYQPSPLDFFFEMSNFNLQILRFFFKKNNT